MSSLKGLASIAKGLGAEPSPEMMRELTTATDPVQVVSPPRGAVPRPLAKTRNHDYKRVMVLVKKATEKAAYRKWEDAHPNKDFSDLVEELLSGYADGSISV